MSSNFVIPPEDAVMIAKENEIPYPLIHWKTGYVTIVNSKCNYYMAANFKGVVFLSSMKLLYISVLAGICLILLMRDIFRGTIRHSL